MWISQQALYSKCTFGQFPNSSHSLWVSLLLHQPRSDDWNWATDQRCIQNKRLVMKSILYVLAWQTFEAPIRPIPSQNPKNVRRMPWLPIEIGIFSIIMAGHARNKYAHQLLSVLRTVEKRSVWVGSFHYPKICLECTVWTVNDCLSRCIPFY